MNKEIIKVCTRCVMNSTDRNITFNQFGVCDRCTDYDNRISKWWNHGYGHEKELSELIRKIKDTGKGKEYDCLLGLSGGLDSSYLLYLAVKKWGLRPFVFHVDAGWDLPVATNNINNLCNKLGVELHVKKLNFNELRQMQIAFFKTGHAGLDAPQDHAFVAQVDYYTRKLGLKYILNGYNIATEVVANPESWYEGAGPTADKTYIKDVLRKNGGYRTKDYIYTTGFKHKFWNPYIRNVKTLQLLNYIPLTKKEMIETLAAECNYEPYRQKHFEDSLTKFLEGWWLPKRFGYDIRIAWLSSLIITGQMKREEALDILSKDPLTDEEVDDLMNEVCGKLMISKEELLTYHKLPFLYKKYRSNSLAFKVGIKLYSMLGLDRRIRK